MATPIAINDISSQLAESDVQRLFDAWGRGRDGWRVFAPGWLLRCGQPSLRKRESATNYSQYSFHPDVTWLAPEWVVLELKRATKMEPLALVEVLHHAWHLGRNQSAHSQKYPIPALLVTSYDSGAWCRSALRYLFDMGLQRTAIRYLEASYYESSDGQRYALFEQPFADIEDTTPPPVVPSGWDHTSVRWKKQHDSETWLGIPDGITYTPSLVPNSFALVSRADDSSVYYAYSRDVNDSQTILLGNPTAEPLA